MDKWIKTYFIVLAIYLLLKTEFPISGPSLFESHRPPQMYDLLSAYFTNRVIRLLRNGICVFEMVKTSVLDTDNVYWNCYFNLCVKY